MLEEIDVSGDAPREFKRLVHPPKMPHTPEERAVNALEQIAAALCRIDQRLERMTRNVPTT